MNKTHSSVEDWILTNNYKMIYNLLTRSDWPFLPLAGEIITPQLSKFKWSFIAYEISCDIIMISPITYYNESADMYTCRNMPNTCNSTWADMEKGVDTRTLSAEIFENCGNFWTAEDWLLLFWNKTYELWKFLLN